MLLSLFRRPVKSTSTVAAAMVKEELAQFAFAPTRSLRRLPARSAPAPGKRPKVKVEYEAQREGALAESVGPSGGKGKQTRGTSAAAVKRRKIEESQNDSAKPAVTPPEMWAHHLENIRLMRSSRYDTSCRCLC